MVEAGARSARGALRDATRTAHDRVDALFAAVDLTDRAAYGRFLSAQAAAHLAIERALDAGGAAALLPDWPARRRAALILADLAALGRPEPPALDPPPFDTGPALLGGIYVLEGSRLGGQLLKRSVPAEFPTRFLSAGDATAWRRLLAVLDDRLATTEDVAAGIKAAYDVFGLFERAGAIHLKAK